MFSDGSSLKQIDTEVIREILARIEQLEDLVGIATPRPPETPSKSLNLNNLANMDFSINSRAFVSRYVGDMSGPKKFTLLLAYLAKGDLSKEFALKEIVSYWKRMSSKKLLGPFNRFYSNEAKTRGWVDSKNHGGYHLTSEWGTIYE